MDAIFFPRWRFAPLCSHKYDFQHKWEFWALAPHGLTLLFKWRKYLSFTSIPKPWWCPSSKADRDWTEDLCACCWEVYGSQACRISNETPTRQVLQFSWLSSHTRIVWWGCPGGPFTLVIINGPVFWDPKLCPVLAAYGLQFSYKRHSSEQCVPSPAFLAAGIPTLVLSLSSISPYPHKRLFYPLYQTKTFPHSFQAC